LVEFHCYSFIGCQEVCESDLSWLKLEMLPKKGLWGTMGVIDPWNETIR